MERSGLLALTLLFAVLLLLVPHPKPVEAVFKPFGGPILNPPIPCVLPPNGLLLVIGPPQGGNFLYIPGISQLFLFRVIRIGAWTLGLAGEVGECFTGPSFDPTRRSAGKGGLIFFMGTSL